MTSPLEHLALQRFRPGFQRLYGARAEQSLHRLAILAGRYGVNPATTTGLASGSAREAVLITYGDMVQAPDAPPLQVLDRFLARHIGDAFSTLHLLPFFPYSSDDGFSVIHFRQVNPDLGTWHDVEQLAARYRLMVDLVLNHVSRQSGWFRDFESGVAPGRDYFITSDPGVDLSAVVRPRATPLLTPVQTRRGRQHVWTTFGPDQVDLNFANPDVFFELLDILLFYVSCGARIIRLDAIAYLWKQPGTRCIHLPETHDVVKLMRAFLELVAPGVVLLSETNVPHAENISYFGAGDEAHWVYQFALPPLVLQALVHGDASALTAWARDLTPPPPGCSYLNFTASHDGIGVRPLEGLVSGAVLNDLVRHVKARGGRVSSKTNADGSESPYELNITYFDAVGGGDLDEQVARFLCSQTLPLCLQGVPAVYFQSLVAAPNDLAGVHRTGAARSINRHKWQEQELDSLLNQPDSPSARILPVYLQRLRLRASHAAFDPVAPQRVLDLHPGLFTVERGTGSDVLRAVHNVTPNPLALPRDTGPGLWRDLLDPGMKATPAEQIQLPPYACRWLVPAV